MSSNKTHCEIICFTRMRSARHAMASIHTYSSTSTSPPRQSKNALYNLPRRQQMYYDLLPYAYQEEELLQFGIVSTEMMALDKNSATLANMDLDVFKKLIDYNK
ncbi:uncharacterized protein LOC134185177 [Corticium candelabrum]|uniref:uncharacterized protein LOC134185177 n=1 Tax=Corticium candelabrum TaxID=121492 RepID=UPI002E2734D9|nr:uncharacterized protein LOC134185177 [Corticium candelabrum]